MGHLRITVSKLSALLALLFCCSLALFSAEFSADETGMPHLERRGAATQLLVDGKPMLLLAGELHNSSSSSLKYMEPIWPRLAGMSLNTVLTPLTWELTEPAEGRYDFALLDGLLAQARQQKMKIVFLWLAAWKNGMSGYAPAWVKADSKRFPRVMENGREVNILSTLGKETLAADSRALAAVMRHIREVDERDHTVLMMQVENEVGVLGDTRDHSPAANRAFYGPVPADLTAYLAHHRDDLYWELRDLWQQNGSKTSGTWEDVFGPTTRTDEIFMAWNYARYVHAVAAAGKLEYPLPMYVNTWLAGEESVPGDYPSGGPQPRVVDIWKAARAALAKPSIDMYTPDIYQPNLAAWCNRYGRAGNPMFIPETNGGAVGAANAFYAFGEKAAIGFSPFAIDSSNAEAASELGKSYAALAALEPLLTQAQANGAVHGFTFERNAGPQAFVMGDYLVQVSLDEIFGNHAERGFGLIAMTGPAEFIGAGRGFRVSFQMRKENEPQVGIASIDEGRFENGQWTPGRRLNGDENDQGSYWRFDSRQVNTEKIKLYQRQ